jgi:hypothetical protein
MNEPRKRAPQNPLMQSAVQIMKQAAQKDKVNIQADALALVVEPDLVFMSAPIAGLEKLDFKALLNGKPVLDATPIMYWYLSGNALDSTKKSLPAGTYTVIASQKKGTISLRNRKGQIVAEGDLSVSVDLPPKTSAWQAGPLTITCSIDKFVVTKKGFELCGKFEATLSFAGKDIIEVSAEGCIEVTQD